MPANLSADMVMHEALNGGTGPVTLGAIVARYVGIGTQRASGDRITWREESADGLTWQEFEGTLSYEGAVGKVSREALLLRSDGVNAFINWPDGVKRYIFPIVSAQRVALFDSAGGLPVGGVTAGNHAVPRDYALGIPAAQIGTNHTDWSSAGVEIGTTPPNVFLLDIPAKTRRVWGTCWLDVVNTDGALVSIISQAVLLNRGTGQDIAQRLGSISRSANGLGSGVVAPFDFTFDSAPGPNIAISVRARKSSNDGRVFAYNGSITYAYVLEP